ncbi:PREDICTED: p53-induced death domain-containing protein 1-like [Branchiostoma belcheri]|uniref:Leucine-rich repeat protein SHOC-2 n=1 Tax=Branchiostoma belcheri TaxID=7741 RepID=A0A6P4YU37_BRABE|nr:PREDICTED: p53-induced death domain-containing protein 1-like [Branchiostoma belcheri]
MDRRTPRKPAKASAKTTPKRKQHKREGAKDDNWTEAYLRAQMTEEKELNISQKCLNEIPAAVFRIREAEILDVSDNPLVAIPADIANLYNLKEMKAGGCPIKDISEAISRCAHISKMDFSRNPQISALPETMVRLKDLKYISLSDCKLNSLPSNLTLLATVEFLDLSKNSLTTLPADISGLKQLKVLILNGNAFKFIPESANSLGCLEILEMKRNKLNNHKGDLRLKGPRKLKILDLEENSSLRLLPDGLENLEVIESLNVSYCGIETLPDTIGLVSSLKEIHLAGNKLRTLPDSFGSLLNLETLDLEGNRRLSSLPTTLHQLRQLKDKKIGTKTGLVLYDTPVLQLPDHEIVKKGVVSVRTELLVERCINSLVATIGAVVIDETIIEDLSENVVEIVKESICDITMDEVVTAEQECEDNIFRSIYEDVTSTLANEVSKEYLDEENAILDATSAMAMEELLQEITDETAKAVALEQEEEWRLGQTVPDEYDKEISCQVSTVTDTVQSLDLLAGCNLSIPPGATDEDTSVISAVLNPHGYDGTLQLKNNELLVSDIIEMRPSGMTFYKPVKLKIPHSFPKFDCEREYVVMTSEDDGRTWVALRTLSDQEQGQRFVTVEVTHFSSFAVVARPLEHCHRVTKGEASTLTSSEQTEIKLILLEDSIPEEKEISFNVTPVDGDTLARAGLDDPQIMGGIDGMSHIVNFVKGSNLLLNRPATIMLPLSPGEKDGQVRVLSCNDRGQWEDITSQVEDVVLKETKVAFKTDRLSSGFVVLRCGDGSDTTGVVNLVTKNVRARHVRTVIFKKWIEPRELGKMTARMECVLEESVQDRICRTINEEKYELQEGTPTPPVSMVENETFCALFHGNIHPDVEMVNDMYGVNFTFYCERTRRLEFDVKVEDMGRDAFSMVELYPGPREMIRPFRRGERARPAVPLTTAEISVPTGPNCDYWLACQRFKNTLEIEDTYFSPDHDKCFCETCHRNRGEPDSYLRGNPETKYAVPVGWARFGLSINPSFKDKNLKVFENWHRAYHGTAASAVKKILQTSSQLLMPGDVTFGGDELGPGKGRGFDSVQVFTSPSIKYSGRDIYAEPKRFQDNQDRKKYTARVAFQVCVRPGCYKVMGETVGATGRGETIDPLFSNQEMEWFTKERGAHTLYGLLVKLEE